MAQLGHHSMLRLALASYKSRTSAELPYIHLQRRLHNMSFSFIPPIYKFYPRLTTMSTSTPTNTAAWLVAEKARPLEAKSAPYTTPGEKEIVVKNGALGLNLVDWARQDFGNALFPWVTYPCVLGSDVAGEVVEIGSAVKDYNVGDRVLGMAIGLTSNRPADGAFQAYTVLPSHMASKIPSSLTYESASAIPLAISTAACGLFQKEYLGLPLPTAPARSASGETLLIWGGSSGVGSNAIQLAVAAGFEVVSTASPKNFEYVKKQGASRVFDYHSDSVVADIVAALRGKKSAGALAIGNGTIEPCIKIVQQVGGKQFVASANPLPNEIPEGVGCKFIFGSDLKDNEVGPAIFVDYLPKALEDGTFVASPPAEVAGEGLGSVQGALDELKKGVSAKKLVVKL